MIEIKAKKIMIFDFLDFFEVMFINSIWAGGGGHICPLPSSDLII